MSQGVGSSHCLPKTAWPPTEYLYEKDISLNDDKENILKEKTKANFELERSEKILSNKTYVFKARKKLVDIDNNKLDTNKKNIIELECQYIK